MANWKDIPLAQQRRNVGYCRGHHDVTLGDGRARTVKEYDLACKVDSNTNGPRPDTPALVTTGGLVIAPFAVFADLDELRRSLRSACRG